MKYPHIDLIDGLNLTPVPLEFSQSLTTTKWLGSIEKRVNDIIKEYNEQIINSQMTTEDIEKMKEDITNIFSGDFLEDGSIPLEKINSDFINKVEKLVKDTLGGFSKAVFFGLDNDGHFIANIPQTLSEIEFTTNMEGQLILKY